MALKIWENIERPSEVGVYWRLLALSGPLENKCIYFQNRIVLGRGKNCDVILNDIKCSREHAELVPSSKNKLNFTDLNSQNGILLNKAKIIQGEVKENDSIIIGQTIFKVNLIHVTDNFDQVQQTIDLEKSQNANKSTDKRKMIIYLSVFLLVVLFLFTDEEESKSSSSNKENEKNNSTNTSPARSNNDNSANIKESPESKEVKKKLSELFQKGLREYREGNYFRAIGEFNFALMIDPNDPLTNFYLKKSTTALDKEIERNFFKAQRDFESLHYSSAINSYCSIVRYLYLYPKDERYLRAKEHLNKIEEKLGKEKDEIKCNQE